MVGSGRPIFSISAAVMKEKEILKQLESLSNPE